jgi:hypothetical protein
MKLTTQLHMVLRLRRSGPVSPLSHAFAACIWIFLSNLPYFRLYDAAMVAEVTMTYCLSDNYEWHSDRIKEESRLGYTPAFVSQKSIRTDSRS